MPNILYISRFLSFAFFVFSPLSQAEKVTHFSVCDLLGNAHTHHKKVVEIHAKLVATPHGDVLVDDRCGELGGIRLVVPEDLSQNPKFVAMIRRVMAHHASGDVDVIGTFEQPAKNAAAGTFILSAVP